MNKRVETILDQARKLTPEERDELIARLRIEFEADDADGTPEEIEAAWAEEIGRRIDRAERGESTFVPAEVLIARLRAKLSKS